MAEEKHKIVIHATAEEKADIKKCLDNINYLHSQKLYSILTDIYKRDDFSWGA